jgi:hypothetical protein
MAIVPILMLALPQQHFSIPMKHTIFQPEKHSVSKQNPINYEASSKWRFLPRGIVNWNWISLLADIANRSTGLTRSRGIVTTHNQTSRTCVIPESLMNKTWFCFASSVNVNCQSIGGEQNAVSYFLESLVVVQSIRLFLFVKYNTEGKFKNI